MRRFTFRLAAALLALMFFTGCPCVIPCCALKGGIASCSVVKASAAAAGVVTAKAGHLVSYATHHKLDMLRYIGTARGGAVLFKMLVLDRGKREVSVHGPEGVIETFKVTDDQAAQIARDGKMELTFQSGERLEFKVTTQ